ncbi:MAG: hypothetical protein IJ266_02270 [Elusimicrobiaceae bacterium]|nr:hypothetical protein [Elusimicrobiaceae bacterium]
MRFKTALVSLLLICPCAICYGQLRFASVGGEKGYSAMRASYRADLDNGFILIPQYGYYRMSDKEIDEAGSTSRYTLEGLYEINDSWQVLAQLMWQPQTLGYEGMGYWGGVAWQPFYYVSGIKEPWLRVKFGQERTRSYVDASGKDLPSGFRQVATSGFAEAEMDVLHFHLQAAWQKVIKYSSRVPHDVTFSWAEIPYMTAVLQGYIKDAYALRVSYPTRMITPYVSLARYHYDQRRQVAGAVSAGLHVNVWGADVTGGIEVFEPRRDKNRKIYFSLSLEVPM